MGSRAETISAELGVYSDLTQAFPLTLKSKIPDIKLAMNGSIPLPIQAAKTFKQQWMAGLVRPEGRVKTGSDNIEITLANDADNVRFTALGDAFINEAFVTPAMRQEWERQALPAMVTIPAGGFDMGRTKEDNEKSIHRVTFAKPFALGKIEVTQGQWKTVMGVNPSHFNDCGDDCPVENVNWNDVQEYIKKLNAKTGKQYRLPSEAEWEYACRAGGGTPTAAATISTLWLGSARRAGCMASTPLRASRPMLTVFTT